MTVDVGHVPPRAAPPIQIGSSPLSVLDRIAVGEMAIPLTKGTMTIGSGIRLTRILALLGPPDRALADHLRLSSENASRLRNERRRPRNTVTYRQRH